MDDRPRNLRSMLTEAKDASELMLDLAYASVYFGDPDMAEEVAQLEETMSELVHDMRELTQSLRQVSDRVNQQGIGGTLGPEKLPDYKPGKR